MIEVILYKCNCTNLIMISTRLYKRNVEDTKGVIRRRKSKEDRQYNGQRKRDKRTNNDLQNITQKTKDRATGIVLKTRGELRCSERETT